MPLCCIGGVCVPYTAIFPLLALGLQWMCQWLVRLGLLPATWQDRLVSWWTGRKSSTSSSSKDSSCCEGSDTTSTQRSLKKRSKTSTLSTSASTNSNSNESSTNNNDNNNDNNNANTTNIIHLDATDDWNDFWESSSGQIKILKMTASWCRPCQAIQPVFDKLAKQAPQHAYAIVDVDALDQVAAQYSVAALPTFLALESSSSNNDDDDSAAKATVVARYSGSNEAQLVKFFAEVQEATTTTT